MYNSVYTLALFQDNSAMHQKLYYYHLHVSILKIPCSAWTSFWNLFENIICWEVIS